MIVVYPFKVFAVLTGIYVLTDTFPGTPDTTVYFLPGVGATGVFAKDEILVPRKFGVESAIFASL
ncbi:hypothetical protein AKJ65_04380 [candidate division MSBL1 archaeon SCGC-AAA259E19]|uniref:Uncharacterized protein n=1 Tax=candidate division MSBL1 archaeon SCGC-AAA259E19 TaxID=1698264 RepID=A0A133UK24_9EURY|nr:hypothetical protein AKJ65_04380 [candidate division MSBL1 archaeon SCGC-AAA259E19]